MAINKAILLGNVGKTPEIRTFDNGNKVASFSVATTEKWIDRDGEKKEYTEWHNVSVMGKTAEFVEKYVKKGAQVLVEGKIRTRSYTNTNGEKRFVTEVVSQSLQLIGGKKDDSPKNDFDDSFEDDLPV